MKNQKRIVLAYSGGLDTSIILKWLKKIITLKLLHTQLILDKKWKKKIIKNAKSLGVKKYYN